MNFMVNLILYISLSMLLSNMGYGANTGNYWLVLAIVLGIVVNTVVGVIVSSNQSRGNYGK